jgi:hypothetical protein
MEGRRKRTLIAASVGFLLICVVAGIFRVQSSSGIFHKGRSAEEWLGMLEHAESDDDPAILAIKALGTDVMPLVTNDLAFTESKFRQTVRELLKKQKVISLRLPTQREIQVRGMSGAIVVGPVGMPYLMPLLEGTSFPPGVKRGEYVVGAIRRMDTNAAPYLIEGLSDPDVSVRLSCAHLLGEVPNLRTAAALPALGHCTSDSDKSVRARVVLAIGRTLENPTLSLPFLTNALLDVSSTVRFNAAHALWGFGVKAGPAIPAIEHAITNEWNFINEGNDDSKTGPKSHERIVEVLTNAIVDIRDHAEQPY